MIAASVSANETHQIFRFCSVVFNMYSKVTTEMDVFEGGVSFSKFRCRDVCAYSAAIGHTTFSYGTLSPEAEAPLHNKGTHPIGVIKQRTERERVSGKKEYNATGSNKHDKNPVSFADWLL